MAYFFMSLSMRPAYNNPFNQGLNPLARRQHAMNKAMLFLIFVLGVMGVKGLGVYCYGPGLKWQDLHPGFFLKLHTKQLVCARGRIRHYYTVYF